MKKKGKKEQRPAKETTLFRLVGGALDDLHQSIAKFGLPDQLRIHWLGVDWR
jgi:hypothetical protein